MLSWHITEEKWKLLSRKWWDKVLCLECFIELVSKRQNRLVLLSLADFSQIVVCGNRVRGYLTDHKWPWVKSGKKWVYQSKCQAEEAKFVE